MWSSQPGVPSFCWGGRPRPSLGRSRSDAAALARSAGSVLAIAGRGGGQKGSQGSLHRALSSGSKKKSAKSRVGLHRRLGSVEDLASAEGIWGDRGEIRPQIPPNYKVKYTEEYWKWKKMIAFIRRGLRTKKVLRKKLEGLAALEQIRELQRMSEKVGKERERNGQPELPVSAEIPHGLRSPNRRYVGVNLAHGYMAEFEYHVGQPCAEKWESRIWIAAGEAVDSLPGGVVVAQEALFTAGATCVPHTGMELHLGYFNSPEQAAESYDRAAVYLRGWKARTNFAKEGYRRDTVLSQTIACQRRCDFVAAAVRERELTHQRLLALARQEGSTPTNMEGRQARLSGVTQHNCVTQTDVFASAAYPGATVSAAGTEGRVLFPGGVPRASSLPRRAAPLLQEASNVFVKPPQIQGVPNNSGGLDFLGNFGCPESVALVRNDTPPGSVMSLGSMATVSD